MSADNWFIARDKKKLGPYTTVQMKQMASAGQLLPIDMVIKDGTTKWMPASQAQEFFPASGSAPLPPLFAAPAVASAPASSSPSPDAAVVVSPPPASVPTPASGKLLGVVPVQIAPPIIGMSAVVLLALLASFFCGSFLVFFFSFLHNAGAVAFIVLTVRLQKSLYALIAALLTMTAWGWLCFTAVWIIASILGLLAGIAVGIWALFAFRSSDVRALFADASKPGPLDRCGTPVLAGAACGLVVIMLGIGGGLYMVTRDKSNTNFAGTGQKGQAGKGALKGRGPENRKPGKTYLDDVVAEKGPPIGSYAEKKSSSTISESFLYVWKSGDGSYDLVFTALLTKIMEPEFVQRNESDVNQVRLDSFSTV